jgi:pilus assembly protein Flp/PilA
MQNLFARFVKDESGATAIEYGLIAALLSVVIIASLQTISTQLKSNYDKIGTAVTIK